MSDKRSRPDRRAAFRRVDEALSERGIIEGMRLIKDRLRLETRFHKTMIHIKCADCKQPHKIFKQDEHQVKRCPSCQRKMRNARPRKRKRGKSHERVATRGKKRKSKRPEPIIPTFDPGPESTQDRKLLII